MISNGLFYQILIAQIFIFIIGLAVGSFVNCLSWRLENKRSRTPRKTLTFSRGLRPRVARACNGARKVRYYEILFGRSFCDHCRRQLEWWENIPVLSWLVLRGRCRSCDSPIPYQYPLVELLTGIIFLVLRQAFGPSSGRGAQDEVGIVGASGELVFWWLVTVGMMIIFTSDWLYGMIPDVVVLPASLVAIIFRLITHPSILLTHYLTAGLGAFLFFYLIVCLTRGKGMGMGDVKLAFLMGVLLGWPKIFISLWLAFVIGAMVAGFLLILKKKRLSDTMALGPFLVVGFYLALFFGERLWKLFLPI